MSAPALGRIPSTWLRAIAMPAMLLVIAGCAGGNPNIDGATRTEVSDVSSKAACGGESCKALVLNHLARSKAALARRGELESCRISNARVSDVPPLPETTLDTRRHGHSNTAIAMSAFAIVHSSHWYFNDDLDAGAKAIEAIHEWAEADAHKDVLSRYQSLSSQRWPTYGLLTSILNSLFLLDNHPDLSQERRATILSWVRRALNRSRIFGQLPRNRAGYMDWEQRVNNHNARRALLLLYYAIYTDNGRYIEKSSSDMNRTFKAIDRHGVPYDANRGDWALRYINFAVDAAVLHQALLEIVDPESVRRNRKNLDKLEAAAVFLFREAVSPNRIHAYARKNIGRPAPSYAGRQSMRWKGTFNGGFVWWAYVDTTIFRFGMPAANNAARDALFSRSEWRTTKYSETGGLVSCWFV